MQAGDPTDVTSTLTDLERKLVDLERELSAVAGGTAAAATAAPSLAPSSPAETRDATLRVEDLRGEIADLERFRDQLESAARELVTEYDRLVERLRGGSSSGAGAPGAAAPSPAIGPIAPATPDAAAPPAPAPTRAPAYDLPPAVAAGIPGGAPAPAPAAEQPPAAAPAEGDENVFVGAVVVDAGPFTDITTLQSFEQALARVDGAEDVYVRSFEGNRALIDVRLSNPVPLVRLLREQLSLPITAREAGEGRLTVDMAADSHGT